VIKDTCYFVKLLNFLNLIYLVKEKYYLQLFTDFIEFRLNLQILLWC